MQIEVSNPIFDALNRPTRARLLHDWIAEDAEHVRHVHFVGNELAIDAAGMRDFNLWASMKGYVSFDVALEANTSLDRQIRSAVKA